MEPEVSLPCSQDPAAGPDPEPDESSAHYSSYFPKINSDIFPSTPRSCKWSLPYRFCDQNFVWRSECSTEGSFINWYKWWNLCCHSNTVAYLKFTKRKRTAEALLFMFYATHAKWTRNGKVVSAFGFVRTHVSSPKLLSKPVQPPLYM
jgi:hypothetical protein